MFFHSILDFPRYDEYFYSFQLIVNSFLDVNIFTDNKNTFRMCKITFSLVYRFLFRLLVYSTDGGGTVNTGCIA